MKLAASAFFLLLVCAHLDGDPARLLHQPLSIFRDGDQAWLGYPLFLLLLAVGLLYAAALARARREAEATVSCLAVVLLLVVVLTPSFDGVHNLASFALLLLLFGYYGLLLFRAGAFWLPLHLSVPFALAAATGLQSYGLWQKGFIAYCVLAAAVHHHLLARRPIDGLSPFRRPSRSTLPSKRRKVYRLEPGRSWARRGALGTST